MLLGMKMAADSNMNFHHGVFPPSFYNQHVVSFQSGATSSNIGMNSGRMNSSGGIISTTGMTLAGNAGTLNNTSSMITPGNYSSNMLLEPVLSLKHDTGLAVDWSFQEQAILNDGLIKFAEEPNMMKYIKIAALLHEKTVRDVALRCRWMTKKESVKRRKLEQNYAGKNIKDRKKIVDSPSKANIHPISSGNVSGYSFVMHHPNQNNRFPFDVPVIDDATRHLLEENNQALSQIANNFATFKIQDNIDLFYRTRHNVITILNSMSRTPGIMSHMPPLPVSINENLMNTLFPIFPSTSQALVFGTPNGINLKQEPRC